MIQVANKDASDHDGQERREDKTRQLYLANPGLPGTTIAPDRQLPDFMVRIGWDRKTGLWSCRSVELRSRLESRRCAIVSYVEAPKLDTGNDMVCGLQLAGGDRCTMDVPCHTWYMHLAVR